MVEEQLELDLRPPRKPVTRFDRLALIRYHLDNPSHNCAEIAAHFGCTPPAIYWAVLELRKAKVYLPVPVSRGKLRNVSR